MSAALCRVGAGLVAFLATTATMLVLPVYAAPGPEAHPVETSTEEIALGSVADPAPAADVEAGTTQPLNGVPSTAPTLTVTDTDTSGFSLVGVTWAYDPGVTDTVVQIRVREADGPWGEWNQLAVEDPAGETGTGPGLRPRGGTEPLWTGPSAGVEAELVTRSGARPTDVQLDLVDPGESAADVVRAPADIAATAEAASPCRRSTAVRSGVPTSRSARGAAVRATIKAATIHHTADANGYTAAEVPAIMRSIYRYHTVSRGWGDIGYNVVVDSSAGCGRAATAGWPAPSSAPTPQASTPTPSASPCSATTRTSLRASP